MEAGKTIIFFTSWT